MSNICNAKDLNDILSFDRNRQKEIYAYIDEGGEKSELGQGKPPAPAGGPDTPSADKPSPTNPISTDQLIAKSQAFRQVAQEILQKIDLIINVLTTMARLYDLSTKGTIFPPPVTPVGLSAEDQRSFEAMSPATPTLSGVVSNSLQTVRSCIEAILRTIEEMLRFTEILASGVNNQLPDFMKVSVPQPFLDGLDKVLNPLNQILTDILTYCLIAQQKILDASRTAIEINSGLQQVSDQSTAVTNQTNQAAQSFVKPDGSQKDIVSTAVAATFNSQNLIAAYNTLESLQGPEYETARFAVKDCIDQIGVLIIGFVNKTLDIFKSIGIPIDDSFRQILVQSIIISSVLPFYQLYFLFVKWENFIDWVNEQQQKIVEMIQIAAGWVSLGLELVEVACALTAGIIALFKSISGFKLGLSLTWPEFKFPDLAKIDWLSLLATFFKLPDLRIVKALQAAWQGLTAKANSVLQVCGPIAAMAVQAMMPSSPPVNAQSQTQATQEQNKNTLQGFYDTQQPDPQQALNQAAQSMSQLNSTTQAVIARGLNISTGRSEQDRYNSVIQAMSNTGIISALRASRVQPSHANQSSVLGGGTPVQAGLGPGSALNDIQTGAQSAVGKASDIGEGLRSAGDRLNQTFIVAGAILRTKKEAEDYSRDLFEVHDLTNDAVAILQDPVTSEVQKAKLLEPIYSRMNKLRTRMALMRAGALNSKGYIASNMAADYVACMANLLRTPVVDTQGSYPGQNDDGTDPPPPPVLDPTTGGPPNGSPLNNPNSLPPGSVHSPLGIALANTDPSDPSNGNFPSNYISPVVNQDIDDLADMMPLAGFPPGFHDAETKLFLESLMALLRSSSTLDDKMLALLPLYFLCRTQDQIRTLEKLYDLSTTLGAISLITANGVYNQAQAQGLLVNNAYTFLSIGKVLTQKISPIDYLYQLLIHFDNPIELARFNNWLLTLQTINPTNSARPSVTDPNQDQLLTDSFVYVSQNPSTNFAKLLFDMRIDADSVGRQMGFEFVLLPIVDRLVTNFYSFAITHPELDHSDYARKLGKLVNMLTWKDTYILDLNSFITSGALIDGK